MSSPRRGHAGTDMGGEPGPDDRRLAIGPANYAGQAAQWASAARTYGHIDAFSFASPPLPWMSQGIGHSVDVTLPAQRLVRPGRRRDSTLASLAGVTHLAVDGFLAPVNGAGRHSVEREIEFWSDRGVHVALIAHGSEVRDPDAHMARWDYSFFHETKGLWLARTRRLSARNRAIAGRVDVPLFVSTPDLLLDLPRAHWLPLVVDLEQWVGATPPLTGRRPVVLHLPSRRHPPIKGTRVIEPILHKLHAEGLLTFLAPERVPHAQVPELVASADVVVDQVMTGSYGVAAVEAMAAGRLVVGNVAPEVRALVPDPVPVVDAPPERLESVLRQILSDPSSYHATAVEGVQFAHRWHDGRAAALALDTHFLAAAPDTT